MTVSSFCASSSTPYSKACQISMRHARTCDATRSHKHERKREKGHLPQWKVHRMIVDHDRVFSYATIMIVLSRMRRRQHDRRRTRLLVPLARIIRFSLGAYNNKRVRASGTFAMLAICVNGIDSTYLRKNAVNAHTHCREQKIRVSTCHLPNHPRSSRRRRSTNPPPSGKLIMRYSLFTHGSKQT